MGSTPAAPLDLAPLGSGQDHCGQHREQATPSRCAGFSAWAPKPSRPCPQPRRAFLTSRGSASSNWAAQLVLLCLQLSADLRALLAVPPVSTGEPSSLPRACSVPTCRADCGLHFGWPVSVVASRPQPPRGGPHSASNRSQLRPEGRWRPGPGLGGEGRWRPGLGLGGKGRWGLGWV